MDITVYDLDIAKRFCFSEKAVFKKFWQTAQHASQV